jgi:hypothetical protein
MAEAERNNDVVDMVDYLRDTLREMDETISDFQERRQAFAIKLAAIEASTAPSVVAAAEDYEQRGRKQYETAEDAGDLIAEAHRRYVG